MACKSAAPAGGHGRSQVSAGAVSAGVVLPRASGQTRPDKACKATVVIPSAADTAATFARKKVRGRTGNGASTRTSRRSGNVESQLSTAKRPTTSIGFKIRKCSALKGARTCASGAPQAESHGLYRQQHAEKNQQRRELPQQLVRISQRMRRQQFEIHH